MSVINKMLRDLDSRQSGMDASAAEATARSDFTRDTQVVNSFERQEVRLGRSGKTALLVALGLTLVGGAVGWWHQFHKAAPLTRVVSSTTPAASIPAASAAARLAAGEPARVAALTASPVEPVVASTAVASEQPQPDPQSVMPRANSSLRMDSTMELSPKLAGPAKAPALVEASSARTMPAHGPGSVTFSVPKPVRPPAAPQNAGAIEVLAQAQSLWNAGSHEAAIELLGEALALAERASATGAPSANVAVVAALARELARMEIAQGRVSQALAMLTRLEPILAEVADIWALRGNVAQRLGRHADSAAAYMMALKLKPSEPRWLLGAAVSLAAQGQTTAATEFAERARSAGVLSPEVASYLRQLGVSLP